MSYRDEIVAAMNWLGEQPEFVAVGYNVCPSGGSAGGSIAGVPEDRRWEFPLAENLMCGAAIGLALDGKVPLIWLERADFVFCGLDAIVNHLQWIGELSGGQHKPAAIIRVCVGNKKAPLFTGVTHTQNPTEALKLLLPKMNVIALLHSTTIFTHYKLAYEAAKTGFSTVLVEQKDLYGNE